MTRIAICISGEIRTGVELYKVFNDFFKNVEHDVFIHTWKTDDNQEQFEKICELYQPKKVIYEKYKVEKRGMLYNNSMFYSMMMSNEIRREYEIENNIMYDCVVKYRFDILLKKGMYFPVRDFTRRKLFCSSLSKGIMNTDFDMIGVEDVVFWGNSEVMNIIMDTYRYFNYYISNKTDLYLSPQNILYNVILNYNIHPEYIFIDNEMPFLVYTIWRDNLKNLEPYDNFDLIHEHYKLTK